MPSVAAIEEDPFRPSKVPVVFEKWPRRFPVEIDPATASRPNDEQWPQPRTHPMFGAGARSPELIVVLPWYPRAESQAAERW